MQQLLGSLENVKFDCQSDQNENGQQKNIEGRREEKGS
ncbi:hypothetical protein J2S25_002374 [Mesobacillus stamsii]|uniref:Uncharacterized protein n=1 Tax=Mesobacillus stamsii TaxID=225347 RepID=A0ABU0FW69_9BACI|nr:hypothetical protein [Mesobacillus stamsii]